MACLDLVCIFADAPFRHCFCRRKELLSCGIWHGKIPSRHTKRNTFVINQALTRLNNPGYRQREHNKVSEPPKILHYLECGAILMRRHKILGWLLLCAIYIFLSIFQSDLVNLKSYRGFVICDIRDGFVWGWCHIRYIAKFCVLLENHWITRWIAPRDLDFGRLTGNVSKHLDGFVQDCSISNALGMKILQSCPKLSMGNMCQCLRRYE